MNPVRLLLFFSRLFLLFSLYSTCDRKKEAVASRNEGLEETRQAQILFNLFLKGSALCLIAVRRLAISIHSGRNRLSHLSSNPIDSNWSQFEVKLEPNFRNRPARTSFDSNWSQIGVKLESNSFAIEAGTLLFLPPRPFPHLHPLFERHNSGDVYLMTRHNRATSSAECSYMKQPVVRAADVGYGHVKWSEGRDDSGEIITDTFPSQSPLAGDAPKKSEKLGEAGVRQERDTFRIPVSGRVYEIGRGVRSIIGKNQELEQLDRKFALSDGYAARLFGAFNYMLPSLPGNTIDFLMLGLPLTTYRNVSDALSEKFVGEHVINDAGQTIIVKHCAVYAQPFGSYGAYLQRPMPRHTEAPLALVVDVGYNTIDWLTCEGMVENPAMTDGVELGMSGYLREVAKSIISASAMDANESAVVRDLDKAIVQGLTYRLGGRPVDLEPHFKAGHSILEQAAQSVRNHIGAGESIDVIIVSGGGAATYAPWIQKQFPAHEVITLPSPAHANVRGFHLFGEWIAQSATRATQNAVAADACHG